MVVSPLTRLFTPEFQTLLARREIITFFALRGMSHSEACVAGCVPLTWKSEAVWSTTLRHVLALLFVGVCERRRSGVASAYFQTFTLPSSGVVASCVGDLDSASACSMCAAAVLDARVMRWFAFSALWLVPFPCFAHGPVLRHCSVRVLELTSALSG